MFIYWLSIGSVPKAIAISICQHGVIFLHFRASPDGVGSLQPLLFLATDLSFPSITKIIITVYEERLK